jgi:uncharacterized protein (DUF2141 family)
MNGSSTTCFLGVSLRPLLRPVIIVSLLTSIASVGAIADTLIVEVNNIKKAGEIHVAVYDNAEAFEADRGEKGGAAPGIVDGTIVMVEAGSSSFEY